MAHSSGSPHYSVWMLLRCRSPPGQRSARCPVQPVSSTVFLPHPSTRRMPGQNPPASVPYRLISLWSMKIPSHQSVGSYTRRFSPSIHRFAVLPPVSPAVLPPAPVPASGKIPEISAAVQAASFRSIRKLFLIVLKKPSPVNLSIPQCQMLILL